MNAEEQAKKSLELAEVVRVAAIDSAQARVDVHRARQGRDTSSEHIYDAAQANRTKEHALNDAVERLVRFHAEIFDSV